MKPLIPALEVLAQSNLNLEMRGKEAEEYGKLKVIMVNHDIEQRLAIYYIIPNDINILYVSFGNPLNGYKFIASEIIPNFTKKEIALELQSRPGIFKKSKIVGRYIIYPELKDIEQHFKN